MNLWTVHDGDGSGSSGWGWWWGHNGRNDDQPDIDKSSFQVPLDSSVPIPPPPWVHSFIAGPAVAISNYNSIECLWVAAGGEGHGGSKLYKYEILELEMSFFWIGLTLKKFKVLRYSMF